MQHVEMCLGGTAFSADIRIFQTYAENYIARDNFIAGFQTSVQVNAT
jgi:hypothetical protein